MNQYDGGYTPGGTPPPSSLPGLLTQPGGISNINVVNILIGGNDYFRAIEQSVAQVESIVSMAFTSNTGINPFTILEAEGAVGQQFLTTNANIIQSLTTAITAIQTANPNTHIILDSTPNIADTPIFQNAVSKLPTLTIAGTTYDLPKMLTDFVTGQVANLDYNGNSGMNMPHYISEKALASQSGIGFVDSNGLVSQFISNPTFMNMYINPAAAGPLYTDMFVGDGIHPGTIAQAMLTNAIIQQIDTWYPNAIAQLTNPEILQLAQNAQPKTSVFLSASPRTVNPGAPVAFKASVSSFQPNYETSLAPPPPPAPPSTPPAQLVPYPAATGTLTFIDASNGNKVLATLWLQPPMSGPAGVTFSASLSAGVHDIQVVYSGDSVYPPAVSAPVVIVVGASQAQTKVVNFVDALPQDALLAISTSQIHKWLNWVRGGVIPCAVERAIVKSVNLHLHKQAGRTSLARSNAVAQQNSKRG